MAYPRFQRARAFKYIKRTSGSYALPLAATWANLDTGLDLALNAQVGDVLEAYVSGAYDGAAANAVLNAVTVVGGVIQNYFGSGEPTITTGDGVLSWFGTTGNITPIGGPAYLTVQAGDISSGLVTVRLRARNGSAVTARTLLATATDPLFWVVKNLGPVDPT